MVNAAVKPLVGTGFILLALVMWAVLASGQAGASGELVIDDFVSGTATIGPNCHSVGFSSHSDPSILGGKRQIVVVDGHSCVTGNSPRASYFASSGTAEWWGRSVGNSAVAQYLAYGTAIGNASNCCLVNPERANPQTPLNLSLTTAGAILLDMGRVDPDTAFIRIELFAGNGQRFATFFPIAAGVNSLPLSGFTGLTDAVAADIDGIEFSGQAGGASITLGNGHIFNKIAVESGGADTTPPVVTAPAPLTVECNTTGGVASSDPAILAWLASASATDNVDGALPVGNNLAAGLCAVGVTKTVTFSATDAAGNPGSAASTITVVDTTAPTATASLVPVPGKVDKDEGLFTAVFGCSDICDASPRTTGVIVTPSLAGLQVKLMVKPEVKVVFENGKVKIEGPDPAAVLAQLQANNGLVISSGQRVHFESDDHDGELTFKFQKGVLKVEGSSALFMLKVTCTDHSGNRGMATATPAFATDDDDDDDDD